MPAVIIWNPYLIYPQIIPPRSIKCIECGGSMDEAYWNDGSSASRQPRLLHGIEDIVYLISAIYVCDNRHKLLSHDTVVLSLLPKEVIPFILSHQTGVTRQLFDMCTSLCKKGMTFFDMESFILERRWECYINKQNILKATKKTLLSNNDDSTNEDSSTSSNFWKSLTSNSPSNNILAKCFFAGFLHNEQLYLQEMEAIPIGKCISFDHTFKVASNIGYLREDKQWINVYDSLFLVLNEQGKIVTWQLTKGTSFKEVLTLLQNLASRSDENMRTVYVDDCCKLRSKIENVFGKNISVKLDIFHAVQRISKTLRKRHPYRLQCLQDLRLVFRCDGDSGEKRLSTTPSSEKILLNFENFIKKWHKVADYNGVKLFNNETDVAIERLKKHITLGCLSNIPAGCGTNKNERLHQLIGKYFNRSRIGILLAYALLSVILHSNNATIKFGGKAVSKPIVANCNSLSKVPTLSTRTMGIMPKHQTVADDIECDHWEQIISENSTNLDLIMTTFQKCVQKYRIVEGLHKTNVARLNDYIHAFKEFTTHNLNKGDSTFVNHHDNLSRYGLTVSSAIPNGNCFFQAVAMNIKSRPDRWTELGTTALEPLSLKLREMFVKEITGENRPLYEEFIPLLNDYMTEAYKFLQNGFFDNAFGDLMPLAMATALKASIIIIISGCQYHSTYVTPLVGTPIDMMFLLYNPTESGHYDAIIPYIYTVKDSKASSKTHKEHSSCRCGINGNNSGKSCSPNQSYATRCKCYLSSTPCSSYCHCKNCNNPCGQKPATSLEGKRKRRAHSLQIEIPSSKKFAVEREEVLPTNIWSTFETIVLSELQNIEETEDLDTYQLYNEIVIYSQSNFCTLPLDDEVVLRNKTANQIASKLKHMFEHATI